MSVTAAYQLDIDWDGDGIFQAGEDVTADLISVSIDRGLTDFVSRIARVGRMTVVLDNSNQNYSPPLQANVLPRRQIQLRMTYNAVTAYLFRGYIEDISPDADQYGEKRQCTIVCVDAIALLQLHEARLTLQENKRGDQLISSIVSDCYTPPGTAYDVDLDTFPFAADTWSEDAVYGREYQRALQAISDVCRSNWGWFYVGRNGYPTFEHRHHRLLDLTLLITLSDTMSQLKYKKRVQSVFNNIEVTAHPRAIGTSNEVLWAYEVQNTLMNPGQVVTFTVRFRDPNQKDFYIGGKSVVTPLVAVTDYQMTESAGGAGADRTANFSVSTTVYANSALIQVTNNHATLGGYIAKLQIRGLAVRVYAPPTLKELDAASQSTYQKRTLKVDATLQSDPLITIDQAKYLIGRYAQPLDEIESVGFWANDDAAMMAYARDIEVSARARLTETQTGLLAFDCFVHNLRHTITEHGMKHWVEFDVEKADVGDFWVLDYSQLGLDTRLAY